MPRSSGFAYDPTMTRFFLVLLLALSVAAPAGAGEHNRARDAVRAGQIVPLRAIAQKVRGQYGGKIIDVRLNRSGNPRNWRYAVKVLQPDGRVLIVSVRASDAQILGAR